jgi:membrane associated rhomboid family serine protease
MMGYERSDDYEPLMWVRGYPVHAALLLVIVHCVALIVCSVLQACNVPFHSVEALLGFSSDAVLNHGALWQFFSYPFLHSLGGPQGLWFLVDMFFLFMWGREVERYFGRKTFLALYTGMWLVPPLALTAYSALTKTEMAFRDSYILNFGVFIAFVTIYPNVQFFFGLLAKWIAIALLGIWTMNCIADHDVSRLLVLWTTVPVAFFGTRYASMGSEGFSVLGNLRDRLPQRSAPNGVKPRMKPRRALDSRGERQGDVHESIDPLLDKISQHGLASLTNSERATLEKARVSLLRKDRGV